MLNSMAFANAATVVTAVFYLVFILFSYLAPDLAFGVSKSWLHSMNLHSLKAESLIPIEKAVLGLVSLCLLTWVTVYATIWLYNLWA